jgi:hypothetical protein
VIGSTVFCPSSSPFSLPLMSPPPDLSLSSLSLFLICTSVGPCFPEYCAFVCVHRSTCSSRLPLSPSVVLRFHVSRTRYTVFYITCIVIYLVPQSEYRTCSPSFNFVLPLISLTRPLLLHPSVLPRAGLGQAGFASGSETTRKPLAPCSPLVPSCSPQPET